MKDYENAFLGGLKSAYYSLAELFRRIALGKDLKQLATPGLHEEDDDCTSLLQSAQEGVAQAKEYITHPPICVRKTALGAIPYHCLNNWLELAEGHLRTATRVFNLLRCPALYRENAQKRRDIIRARATVMLAACQEETEYIKNRQMEFRNRVNWNGRVLVAKAQVSEAEKRKEMAQKQAEAEADKRQRTEKTLRREKKKRIDAEKKAQEQKQNAEDWKKQADGVHALTDMVQGMTKSLGGIQKNTKQTNRLALEIASAKQRRKELARRNLEAQREAGTFPVQDRSSDLQKDFDAMDQVIARHGKRNVRQAARIVLKRRGIMPETLEKKARSLCAQYYRARRSKQPKSETVEHGQSIVPQK